VVFVGIVLGVTLTSAVEVYMFRSWMAGASAELQIFSAARAAGLATIIAKIKVAHSSAERSRLMDAARHFGSDIEQVQISPPATVQSRTEQPSKLTRMMLTELRETWGVIPVSIATSRDGSSVLLIRLDDHMGLAVSWPEFVFEHRLLLNSAIYVIVCITFIVLLLCLYGLKWITAPLRSVEAATRAFSDTSTAGGALPEDGPREIAQLAAALNEMRARIRLFVTERTQMCAAIGHDLRTPLTRLSLRLEQISNPRIRDGMMRDISGIDGMLRELLTYLRDGDQFGPLAPVDLAMLLRTLCDEFADVGHDVAYSGPLEYVYHCRASALTRAITNIIDNGIKHGTVVEVAFRVAGLGRLEIEISDNGPGIPAPFRERVFEPFFKIDSSRGAAQRSGFGLGLAIARDIVRRHGGEIQLRDGEPTGLTVYVSLREPGG
jgi:signal transduction histidine kinase